MQVGAKVVVLDFVMMLIPIPTSLTKAQLMTRRHFYSRQFDWKRSILNLEIGRVSEFISRYLDGISIFSMVSVGVYYFILKFEVVYVFYVESWQDWKYLGEESGYSLGYKQLSYK